MPTKKPNQTEPLLGPDATADAGTELAEQESHQALGPMGQRIMDQLRAIDPEPFREVLRDILLSFKGTRWKGLDGDKRIKAAKDLALLAGYAQPSLVINQNHLHVERMNDAELLSELGRARAQLADVMGMNHAFDASVIGTDLASPSPSAADPRRGLGGPASQGAYVQGGHAANRNPEIEDADVISGSSPARPSSPQDAKPLPHQDAKPVTPSGGEARPGSMAAKIAELRAAGKVATTGPSLPGNSKAPAAGAAPHSGKGGKK